MKKNISLIILTLIITTTSFSQKKFIDTGSVKNQFDYLINKSNRYQQYKVVEINWLSKLKSNVIDSLAITNTKITDSYTIIKLQKDSIFTLKSSLATSENTIVTLNSEKESISFLGIQFSKPLFKTIVFLIIGALILFLVIFITKFKQSFGIIKQAEINLKETEEEFETHRKRALEREQKVMRKLQDELNKQKKE